MKELAILYVTSQGEDDANCYMTYISKLTLILHDNLAVFDVNVFVHVSF